MNSIEVVDLCSDDEHELGEVDVKPSNLKPVLVGEVKQEKGVHVSCIGSKKKKKSKGTEFKRQESEENRSSNVLSTGQSSNSVLDQGQSPVDDTSLSSASSICAAPLVRQFWKAGNYEDVLGSKSTLQNGKSYLHVHPMFLHSNATSHKWAFGAIAELLDNAVDEIQNGATFVVIDKTINPRDGSSALLIQDDGGGMDPESMRRCMSFGFSDKKSKSSIGKYGNGFKTSSMRLGADVVVFSRHLNNRMLTQSVGLLSYTFLTRTGHDRIVVPMVDYEFNASTGTLETLHRYGREHFMSNLSILLQWSPFSTEAELLKQFDDIGPHGTKIIVYNLWYNEDGLVELDFDSDPEDIRLGGDIKRIDTRPAFRELNQQHIANRYQYSLRVYLSILYLRIPDSFRIILRGRDVEHHNLATDLKFQEFIMYRPQSAVIKENSVITTIGFLKDAPHVNIHGFNVYHKNRLILPFWQVVSYSDSRGKGVVGVLEANFVEPTHNKQDFERTSLFQKLETRLKEMTWEYWDYHCGLIGYQVKKKPKNSYLPSQASTPRPPRSGLEPVMLKQVSPGGTINKSTQSGNAESLLKYKTGTGSGLKRKEPVDILASTESIKRHAGDVNNAALQPTQTAANLGGDTETLNLLQENKRLRAQCNEFEKAEEELNGKAAKLKSELKAVKDEYARLLAELQLLDAVKEEKGVNM